jgi:antitoxin HicB
MFIKYPVILTPDENGTVIVQFPDVPEAITCGRDEANALEWAEDALLVTLAAGYMDEHRPIPRPSAPAPGQHVVEVPPMAQMKLIIYQTMLDKSISQLKMAKLLHTDAKQIRRILDLDHKSRFDHLEMALEILGYRVALDIRRAA